ncbi:hypothetical protein B296_00025897 [Ensete ventricosum]|uniref:Uncharacterized protein n=1 Tax=Ensete ventricosum TaxID=4639 RepID=A0A426Z7C2_ENSVE|nr:hypothetical protein B296_00025897 [Ensete ventricosum]
MYPSAHPRATNSPFPPSADPLSVCDQGLRGLRPSPQEHPSLVIFMSIVGAVVISCGWTAAVGQPATLQPCRSSRLELALELSLEPACNEE